MKALLSQRWNVIGISAMSCVFTVTCFFFFVFETVREECVYLSGVSVSHVGYLKSWVFLVAALAGLCARAFCISSYVSISHLCLLQGHWISGVYLEHLVFILNTSCVFWIPRIEGPTCGYTCFSSLLLYLQNSWSWLSRLLQWASRTTSQSDLDGGFSASLWDIRRSGLAE